MCHLSTPIIHCFHQNEAPPKRMVQPYKRLTAQEICYQRMQIAQQQAAQLSAAALSAQSSSPSVSGEKKRIAHRPNPQIASSKTRTNAFTNVEFSKLQRLFVLLVCNCFCMVISYFGLYSLIGRYAHVLSLLVLENPVYILCF